MDLKSNESFTTWRSDVGSGYIQGYVSELSEHKPTVHFLHGNGFSVKTYSRFLEQLNGCNLIMQDAAGHGGSSVGKRFVGWNTTAIRFLDSLKIQGETLPKTELIGMGHSFGGCMTVLMNQHKTPVFDRMVLLDPAIFPPRLIWMMLGVKFAGLKNQIPLARQARRRRTHWENLEQVRGNFFDRGTFKGWEDECLDDYISSSIKLDEGGGYKLGCPSWMEAAIFSSYPKGLWRAIAQISVPTYIVQGKDTFDYFKEAYRLASELNSNIHVVEVEGGHCFMQQNTASSAQAVLDILRK